MRSLTGAGIRQFLDLGSGLPTQGNVHEIRPEEYLTSPGVTGFLDFDEPVAVLQVSILHFVQDAADPAGALARVREALAPGSYLALTHAVPTLGETEAEEEAKNVYRRSSAGGAVGEVRLPPYLRAGVARKPDPA
ncbi:SAM-dependent methyltransferase [Nonomuraea typhae]|uniref:SAM-dependent methyltransferase n=1 Tax=Nonomuraea typhae TaxID=2603600 RepID=UPI001FE93648|nr:SAM-dependent methyltransferase [Nonomuraea typhae]